MSEPSPEAIKRAATVYLTALERLAREDAEIAARGIRPWDLPENWWDKVAVATNDCWFWTGARNSTGYACVTNGLGQSVLAHRMVYELFVGPIPDGTEVRARCGVDRCVAVDHLAPVVAEP